MTVDLRRSLLLVLLYVGVLGSAALVLTYRFDAPANTVVIDAAEFAASVQTAVDAIPAAAWQAPLTLPDDWRRTPHDFTHGWYRMRFDVPRQPTQLWAVVLPTVRYNAEVFLNGQALGNGGSFDDPVTRNVRRPLIFNIPASTLLRGENILHVRVKSGPDQIGFLDRVYIGHESDLRPAYSRHYAFRVTTSQVITIGVFFIGVVVGMLSIVRRADREYQYFGAGAIIWAIHSLSYVVADVPFSDRFWDWLTFATTGAFAVVGGVLYVHRYLGKYHTLLERRVALAILVLILAMTVLADRAFYLFAYYLWLPLCQAIALYGLYRIYSSAWRKRNLELHMIAVSGLVITLYGTHDLAVAWGLLPWSNGYVLHYSLPMALALFCVVLLRRFVRATNELETLNAQLERRMREARDELEASYSRFNAAQHRRAVIDERDRIMRDMHDGMGGQLITTLAMIDEGNVGLDKVADSLRAALQDLRLMIDSLDVAGEDITTMLGMFRARIETGLEQHNIALSWRVEPLGEIPNFGAAKALHVLRILQEAVTNVIKHSGAGQIVLAAKDRAAAGGGRQVIIELHDDGCGYQAAQTDGRGIANMHSRARAIGAALRIDTQGGGTRVTIVLERG